MAFTAESFARILEGSADAVERTFAPFRRDPQHRDIVVRANLTIVARDVPNWSMALSINGRSARN